VDMVLPFCLKFESLFTSETAVHCRISLTVTHCYEMYINFLNRSWKVAISSEVNAKTIKFWHDRRYDISLDARSDALAFTA